MRPAFPFAWLMFTACTEGPESIHPDRPASVPGVVVESTESEMLPWIAASCEPQPENTLRFNCTVSIDPAGPVQIAFQRADGLGPVRTHKSGGSLAVHEVDLYFMNPETEYTWLASSSTTPEAHIEGDVVTGSPPAAAVVSGEVTGVSSADAFLLVSPCGGGGMPIVVDPSGALLWYEQLLEDTFIESVILTEDDTVMLLKGPEVLHQTWVGEVLFRVTPTARTHHDVYRRNGLNYVLFKEGVPLYGRTYTLDGFVVFDNEGTVLAEWHLADHFTPPDDPGLPVGGVVIDYSHANAIFVQEDGDILVSFRHLSAIFKVNGDLADPDFGEVIWRLVGDPDEMDLSSDFALTSTSGFSPDFVRQHNFHQNDDGRYLLFDNRFGEFARVSVLSLDEGARTANIEHTWDTGLTCSFQGSAWSTPVGNPVGACAQNRRAQEFDIAGYPLPLYSLTLSCDSGASTYIPRFIPMDLY